MFVSFNSVVNHFPKMRDNRTNAKFVLLYHLCSMWTLIRCLEALPTITPRTFILPTEAAPPPSDTATLRCPDPVGFHNGTIKYRLRDVYIRGGTDAAARPQHVPSVYKVRQSHNLFLNSTKRRIRTTLS